MKATSLPPHAYFLVSALFHYLGPSFAVLLFAELSPLGVAWLRIASAALIFAFWVQTVADPGQSGGSGAAADPADGHHSRGHERLLLPGDRPAAARDGCCDRIRRHHRTGAHRHAVGARNLLALIFAVVGVFLLVGFQYSSDVIGLGFAFANAILFALYVVVGHAIARQGGASGIDPLGSCHGHCFHRRIALRPWRGPTRVIAHPLLILAGIGVGISSSVIPYVCDQLAMARLPRASFALMLTLLPAIATVTGAIVLRQIPGPVDLAGIFLVILGVALHRPAEIEQQS